MYSYARIISLIILINNVSVFGVGEKVPFSLLRRLLPSNPVIVEAGAQFGEDTAWMSEFWYQGKVYAFEPNPEAYIELQKVSKSRDNVCVESFALSNKKGKFPFYLAGGASSLLQPTECFNKDYFHADLDKPIYVETVTLDEWAANKGITAIDFLWLDMEGNELNALQGASNILKTVKVIYTEVNLQKFWTDCVMFADLTQWLATQGFEKVWEDITPHWHGNVLYVKKDL